MKSLLFSAAAVCLLLGACSSGSASSDVEDSSVGTSEGTPDSAGAATSEAEDQTPESEAPEDTASAVGSSEDGTVAEALYREHLAKEFPTTVSDETLDCMVETALDGADAEQLAGMTENNFSDFIKENGDLVDTLFEDEGAAAKAQLSSFNCLTDEEFSSFLEASGGEPEEVACVLDELGGKDRMIELLIETEVEGGEQPQELIDTRETCNIG